MKLIPVKLQAGRVNVLLLGAIGSVVLILLVLFFGKESLSSVGVRFMSALAKGDVDTLTDMSYLGSEPKDSIRKKWDFAVNKVGKYYHFAWKVTSANQADANSGAVRLSVMRNVDSGGSYEENFQLPLVRTDGQWKVDVKNISREMFPGLPR